MINSPVGITIVSCRNRIKQNSLCLDSLLANTDLPYRLIWHHVCQPEGNDEATQYLLEKYQSGKIHHLFLHRPEDDWWLLKMANASAEMFSKPASHCGVERSEWFIHATDDMQFLPGWLSHTMSTIEKFQDIPVGMWSPYRPPEHPSIEYIQRGEQGIWLYQSIAPRCMVMKLDLFLELGGWDVTKGHVADWVMTGQLEAKGYKHAVIDGYKVLHKDFGDLPAHGVHHDHGEHSDEMELKKYGGYRGEPGTGWPAYSRPSV